MFYLDLGVTIGIIIGSSIIGLWLLTLIVNLIFVSSFNSIFKKHKKAIPVILFTKCDSLKSIISILSQSGIDVDNRYVALVNDISFEDFIEPGSVQFEKSKNTLTYLKDELLSLASTHPELEGDEEFVQAKRNIVDSDTLYRTTVMMYNADVLGYNYWIRFLPCRFVFLIFKVKKKTTIS